MIVKCERCQTRFKIPDEKVTEKGVKVRCAKCQHTFRVVREDAPSATPAPSIPFPESAAPARPPATPRAGTPIEVPRTSAPATSPPVPWGNASPQGKAPSGPGIAAPRGGAPATVPRVSGLDLSKTPATIDLDPLLEFIGENTPTPAQALKLATKATTPDKPAGALALGPAQPKPAPTPVPARSAPAVPVQVPARSPAPAQPRGGAPMSLEENDPFALPPDDAPSVPATPTLPPRSAAPAPSRGGAPMSLEENDPFALPPDDAPVPAPAFEEMDGLEGNNPFATFDPVAALPPASKSPAPSPTPAASGIPDWGAPQGAVPAGIPDWGAPQTAAATPTAKPNTPTERNPFQDSPGPGSASPSRTRLPAVTQAPAKPVIAAPPAKMEEAPGTPQGPRLAQRLAAVSAQLVLAAVLVVGLFAVGSAWLNGGRVELSALSPSHVRERVSPTRPLVAKDLSNGLYETRDGHPLFFVRGEVENRGTAPIRVKAGVVLYDGAQQVKSAEGIAGAVPSPEELYALQSASEADALRARLDAAAKEVAPGARAPFVVFFYEYPAELAGFRLEVTLEPWAAVAAAGAKEGAPGNVQP